MPNLPQVTYRVIDSTELDDLVIWTKQSCLNNYLNNPVCREDLHRFLQRTTATKYFAGPVEHQTEFDPAGTVPADSSIVVHIQLGSDDTTKAFLYLNNSTIEFHIPESFLVTGVLKEDVRRYELIRELADGLRRSIGMDWQMAEYGGATTIIEDYDDFWSKYKENAFERIDYENVGG